MPTDHPGENSADSPAVYRPIAGRLVYVAVLAVGVWWAGAVLVADGPGALLPAGPVLAGIAVLGWSAFWRSAVVADERGVRLLNVLRDVDVEWPALDALSTRWALTLHVADRQFRSWAATSRDRAAPRRRVRSIVVAERDAKDPWAGPASAPGSSSGLVADAADARAVVEDRWERWKIAAGADRAALSGRVAVRWNVPVIGALALCAVATVVSVAVR